MKSKTFYLVFLVFIIFLSSNFLLNLKVNTSLNNPGHFDEFDPLNLDPNFCDCHTVSGGSITQGSGSIIMNSINETTTNTLFNVTMSIKNFTEAATHSMTFGLGQNDGNNSLFSLPSPDYKTITLDINGSSLPTDSFTLLVRAPSSPGSYILKARAVDAYGPNGTDQSDIHYLYTSKTITVAQGTGGGITGDITADTVSDSKVIIGDSAISDTWSKVNAYNVPEFSDGSVTGYIKTMHDNLYFYALIAYSSSLKWIAIEFNASGSVCMGDGHDGWVFGDNFYGDYHFTGSSAGAPTLDVQNDIFYEKISNNGVTFIEMRRMMNTGDTNGKDVVFKDDTLYNVKFASNLQHTTGDRTVASLAVSSSFLSGQSGSNVTTTSIPLAQIKSQHLESILFWAGMGLVLNIFLIITIFIYRRRSI